jgi:ribosomal protein L37AE/L43A
LIFPEWSESVNDRQTINIWHCPACGHEFETTDNVVEQTPSDAELIEEFLPNLLVA